MEIVNHPNWLTFARELASHNKLPRVAIFINIRLLSLHFSFCKDIINHRDILLLLFFNNGDIFYVMNVYSDSSHSTIKYLKDMDFQLRNLIIMTGDFNIYDSLWDPSYNFHSSISDDLFAIADSFNLFFSFPMDQVPTGYSDNTNDSNSVLDLMFLRCDSEEINLHIIYPDWRLTSDHAPLTIIIPITDKYINIHKHTIIKDSIEEVKFVNEVIALFSKVDTSSISNIYNLDEVVSSWVDIVSYSWLRHSKPINITKCSKSWWNNNCSQDLASYRSSKSIESWKTF